MAAILEIPGVRQRVSKLSVQEYHRLDEFNGNGRRTELIRGILIEQRVLFTASETIDCGSVPGVRVRIAGLFV